MAAKCIKWQNYVDIVVALCYYVYILTVFNCECVQDAIEKCSALLFFPFLSCHENIDPNPFVASCVADICL